MSTYTHVSCADTAKQLRLSLKAEFPGAKFSVRSSTYANGASIHVTWQDGPTQPSVDAVCQRFAGATFDGMIDLKSYVSHVVVNPDGTPEEVHWGSDYVFANRHITPEFRATVDALWEADWGKPYDHNPRMYDSSATYHYRKLLDATVGPLRKSTSWEGCY